MVLAWLRRGIGTIGWLALAGASGISMAGESLPPLRVDPVLLGGTPLKPAPKPAPAPTAEKVEAVRVEAAKADQPAGKPETRAAAASTANAAEAPALPPSSAEVSPVAPPPVARELPAAAVPAQADAAPVAPAPVAPAPIARLARAPANTARNLPPLRVDPALLGGGTLARTEETRPPEVAERPALPPLYSAHVAAGAIPAPDASTLPPVDKKSAPTYVTARNISGVNEVEVVAEGAAELRRAGDTLRAERITYRQDKDEVEAVGDVHLTSVDSTISGPRLRMQMAESTGEFAAPSYTIRQPPKVEAVPALTMMGLPVISKSGKVLATTGETFTRPPVTGSGSAELLEFRGEDKYRLSNATYSTCAPTQRDWEVAVDELDLDYTTEVGEARNATVRFKNVPLFHTPWLNFSLNNQRKSGLLAPTVGSTSKSGLELTMPWYWNIAPNMDATIAPRLLSRRGVQLNTEFRYLDATYNGLVRAEYLPDDRLANIDRYGYVLRHNHNLGNGFSAALNLNGVSDDTYFSDLSTRMAVVAQGNLLRQGVVNYAGPWYGGALNVQTYQTLNDPDKPPLPTPYYRLPQLTAYASRHDLPLGLSFNLNGEYVNFDHPTLVLGRRTTLYPQLSLPLATEAFWLTSKLGFHSTRYQLERQGALPDQQSRALPVFSVDGGFTLERNTDWFGRALLQTLEPRAYYLYVPNREQGNIPVFDTAIADFNHAQMFAENRYAGGDRFADANQLTLAVTSRLLDPDSGAELLRATLGQRYYFTLQHVTLPGEVARVGRSADMLAALSGQVMPKTYADFGWQYNPRDRRTERLTLGARYQPQAGQVLNTTYRYTRDQLGQIDVSGQWPLAGGWHGVGRYNYSTKEHRVIETIGGLEYDGGCWVGRFVVQRIATLASSPSTALFLQLELNDFSRIGSNPLELLRRNIPGYGVINQPTADPVFAAQ